MAGGESVRMYKIYMRHFLAPESWIDAGSMVEEETLIYELPGDYPQDEVFLDPKVKNEMGKAGTFEFGMEMTNPYYACLNQMTTLIRVEYDEDTIFYGRVLAVDTDMWGKRQVHCEGALAFLLDTLIIATKEEEREEISLADYVKSLIGSHNNMVADEPNKRFHYGQIPGYYSDTIPDFMKPVGERRKFGSGSWTSTLNCLEDLTSKYGGYWRARYDEYVDPIGQFGEGNIDLNNRTVVHNPDGTISTENPFSTRIEDEEVLLPTIINGEVVTEDVAIAHYKDTGEYLGKFSTAPEANRYAQDLHERQDWFYHGEPEMKVLYLDWFLNMFDPTPNNQPMRLTENIVDMSGTVDVNGIFTVLIPEGVKKGKPLYLDDIPKTVTKTKRKKRDKDPPGPAQTPAPEEPAEGTPSTETGGGE